MVLHCEFCFFSLFLFVRPDLEQKALPSLIGESILAECTSVLSVIVSGTSSHDKTSGFSKMSVWFSLYHTLYDVCVRILKVLLSS